MWTKVRPHLFPCIIAAIMSLIAVANLPYGYYMFLRWAVCAVSVFVAVLAFYSGQSWAIWVYGALAVLFNPILRIHLSKGIWQPINIIAAGLLVVAVFVVKRPIDET